MHCDLCGGECTCHINPPCDFCLTHDQCTLCGTIICYAKQGMHIKDGKCPNCGGGNEQGCAVIGNEQECVVIGVHCCTGPILVTGEDITPELMCLIRRKINE